MSTLHEHVLSRLGPRIVSGSLPEGSTINLEWLHGKEVVAVAGGEDKTAAIAAVLRSGLVTGLITDEATAARLVEVHVALGPGNG